MIELAVVLAVLAVAAALVLPRLNASAIGRGTLRSSIARLAALAAYARDQAASTRHPHSLDMDLKSGDFWVSVETPDGTKRASADGQEIAGRLPEGARFRLSPGSPRPAGDIIRVRFAPQGWADPFTVHLAGEDGRGKRLVIAGLAGRIEVHDD